jgi:hypothetical protein
MNDFLMIASAREKQLACEWHGSPSSKSLRKQVALEIRSQHLRGIDNFGSIAKGFKQNELV